MAKGRFQVGGVYEIEYDDHWSADRVYRDSVGANADPPRLSAIGRVTSVSDRVVVLEHSCHVTDEHPTNKRVDQHGIVRSCIVNAARFIEEPNDGVPARRREASDGEG